MFEHLVQDRNRIEVVEQTKNRDGDVIQSATIGVGYGVFSGLSKDELSDFRLNNYNHASVLVHYDGKPLVLDSASKSYVCIWRCREYKLSKIKECYDIHGTFQGYRVYTQNG